MDNLLHDDSLDEMFGIPSTLWLLHFIWEQLQQKTSQQSIQHSRWQLFVSISLAPLPQWVQVIYKGEFCLWRSLIVIESLFSMINPFWDLCTPKIKSFLVYTWLKTKKVFIFKKYLVKKQKDAPPKMISPKYILFEISWSMKYLNFEPFLTFSTKSSYLQNFRNISSYL